MNDPAAVLNRSRTGKRHVAAIALLVAAASGVLYIGYRPWKARQTGLMAALREQTERLPVVTVSPVKRSAANAELVLPGTIAAVSETAIYARSEGYIKARHVDIGDRVKAGQLLVEIDTPELDQQLRQVQAQYSQNRAAGGQSRAALKQMQANLHLAEVNLRRSEKLVAQGILARQDGDDKQAAYDVQKANVEAAQAAVDASTEAIKAFGAEVARIQDLTNFKMVTAPYDGVITARNCDTGNLITSAALASGRDLFRLADLRTVRLMINVPEPDAPAIRPGTAAAVTLQEFGARIFHGSISRSANALDSATRTLLTEVQVANPDGALMPGMYAQVKLSRHRASAPWLAPGDTLVVRADGTYVAAVLADRTVRFKKIVTGRDFGADIEALGGLDGDELLIRNPTDTIRDGSKVLLAQPK